LKKTRDWPTELCGKFYKLCSLNGGTSQDTIKGEMISRDCTHDINILALENIIWDDISAD